jgi:translation initiation factor 2B subunit (eIF-2B alpha/beta/delta family)
MNLSIKDVNERINKEICHEIIEQLTDNKLIEEYKNCNSLKKEIIKLKNTLEKYTDEKTSQDIIQDYLLQLIPAGTKGVIRGNTFNNIIKNFIINLQLNADIFEIYFEKKCEIHLTTEIPDWYILEKKTSKIIIGMNQLDLWGGGQQINRGSKYIENNKHNNEKSKLLCVVCNEIQFTSEKSKTYKLIKMGFENNTLCYIKNLENIIRLFFG